MVDDNARYVIEQLWLRARINAFANRHAADESKRRACAFFVLEIVCSLLSIMFIIAVYVLSTNGFSQTDQAQSHGLWPVFLTGLSIFFTFSALFLSIMASYLKLDIIAERYASAQSTYLYISQRAREVKWLGMSEFKIKELLEDLEREFALQKLRGTEPSDRHFVFAARLMKKISTDEDSQSAQSFPLGEGERLGQKAGELIGEEECKGR